MTRLVYLLFFCSGASGLIYQVVWVRVFGNVFGNTIYSASLVVAVFMLGLGVGGWVVGAWADRRYAERPRITSSRTYGYIELLIGLLGAWRFRAPATVERRLCARLLVFARRERLVRPFDRLPSRAGRHRRDLAHADHVADGRDADASHSSSRSERSPRRRRRIAVLYGINTAAPHSDAC